MLPITLQSRVAIHVVVIQLARKELNLRPASYKDAALTAELRASELGRRDLNPHQPD